MQWSPSSPNFTPCDIFLWKFVNNAVFVPILCINLQKRCNTITTTEALINLDMNVRDNDFSAR
ncbi:hypothetical protein C0J52_15185 [Blattella germanica]|nr:hypothetical protein C0J52_15185 [Blattella germanica]